MVRQRRAVLKSGVWASAREPPSAARPRAMMESRMRGLCTGRAPPATRCSAVSVSPCDCQAPLRARRGLEILEANGRPLKTGDDYRRLERARQPSHLDANSVAETQTLEFRAQLGPCPDRYAVQRQELVTAVEPRPTPDTRRIGDDQTQAAVAFRFPAIDAQIALRLAVEDRRRPGDARAEADQTEVAVEIDGAGVADMGIEEPPDIAAAHRRDGSLDDVRVDSLGAGSLEQQSHHVVHRAPAVGRVANHEIEHRSDQLTLEVGAGAVIAQRARLDIISHAADGFGGEAGVRGVVEVRADQPLEMGRARWAIQRQ